MNTKIGFDCIQTIMEHDPSMDELDECMRVLNNFYRVYRPQLEIIEWKNIGLNVALVDLDTEEVVKI